MSKEKKEKVIYYDDGSTIANMDNVGKKKEEPKYKQPRATEREKLQTFFQTFKMMLVPCGVVLLILLILYILFSLLVGNF